MHKIEEESTLAAWRWGETDMLKIKRNSAHRICLFWRFWKQRVPVYSLCVMPWNSVLQSGSSAAPYITYEQGNMLTTCCSKKLESTMVPEFPLVSIPGHLMGPRACGRDPTVTTTHRGSQWRFQWKIAHLPSWPIQTKLFLKGEGGRKVEEEKKHECFTYGIWMSVQNMSNKVHVWDMHEVLNLWDTTLEGFFLVSSY